jgi:hypothetical protein
MKTIQGLVGVLFLAAGLLMGAHWVPSFAHARGSASARSPGTALPAEIAGTTLVSTDQTLSLRSAWQENHPASQQVLTDYAWKLDGKLVSTSPTFEARLTHPGTYTLEVSYYDSSGQLYTYQGPVQVVQPQALTDMLSAVGAATRLMLMPEDAQVFLPAVMK